MKREPRLQFSDADLAEPKLEKPIKRVKKAEAKADKAQAKIPKKTVVKKERGFDPATGKVKTQLRFEEVDKKKPPSKLTHAVQDAPANFVLSGSPEVRQSEDDNGRGGCAQGRASRGERRAAAGASAHRAHQLKPYRAAIPCRKLERANLDALQKKAEIDSPPPAIPFPNGSRSRQLRSTCRCQAQSGGRLRQRRQRIRRRASPSAPV